MSEFGESDVMNWLMIALQHDCSIQKAIYYDVYFSPDQMKFTRAFAYFCDHFKLKNPHELKHPVDA